MKFERMRCGLELKLAPSDTDSKVGTFKGYGSVFNNIDAGGDLVAPGAFKHTLKEWKAKGKLPKMLLMHGGFIGPAEDGIPVGKYSVMEEDDKGLYLEGELFALDTQKGKYIHEGMKSGELDGLSIGYEAIDVSYGKKPDEPRRTLKKVKLYEVSIVTFGMNDKATVDSAKSIEDIMKISDVEAWLREACGLSHSQSRAAIARFKTLLSPRDAERSALDAAKTLLSQIHAITGVKKP